MTVVSFCALIHRCFVGSLYSVTKGRQDIPPKRIAKAAPYQPLKSTIKGVF